MLAQNRRDAERLTSRTFALRRGVGIDLPDQPRDQIAIHLRAEMTPAGERGELKGLFRGIAPGLEVFSSQPLGRRYESC